jgi:heterodisulfide reductase subunit A-like polyferredoxin/coenzyme F420-reducing hydrogenase delta subunit
MLAENTIGIVFYHHEKRGPSPIAWEDLRKVAETLPEVGLVEDFYQDHWETSVEQIARETADRTLSRLIIVAPQGNLSPVPWSREISRWGFRSDQVSVVNIRPALRGVEAEADLVREKALLLLKRAVARQETPEDLPLETVETVPRILILGGGLAGLLAAQEALKLGLEALILESGKNPGAADRYEPEAFPENSAEHLEAFLAQPGLRVVTEARLLDLAGLAGAFTVRYLDGEDRSREEKVGAVLAVLPPEVKPNFEAYGLKEGRQVLTLSQLETLLRSKEYQEKVLPLERTNEVVFLLGLKNESGPPVVGRALSQARRLQARGDTQVYVLSGNMKVAAEGLEREYTRAREDGVLFFRFTGDPPQVEADDQGPRVAFVDEILDLPVQLKPELLVVDDVLVHHALLGEYAHILGIARDPGGFLAPNQVYALPVRTPRTGIYAAGGSRRPYAPAEEIQAEVEEAVLSAAELLGPGKREVPASRVEVDRKKCTICLTCVRSCPHQALHFLYRRPQASTLACQACGVCAAECPMDAIQIRGFRDETLEQEISLPFGEGRYATAVPQVVAFCCRNSAEKSLQQALLFREPLPAGFEFIPVPCAGKVDPDQILQAFRAGADGVVILACPIEGCRSFEGNKKAWERVQFLRETLTELGLEPERLQFETPGPGMMAQFAKTCAAVEDRIRQLGTTPVRRARGIQQIYDRFTFPVDSKTFEI